MPILSYSCLLLYYRGIGVETLRVPRGLQELPTRAERNHMRKQYRKLDGRHDSEGHLSEASDDSLPPRLSREFLKLHLRTTRDNFWKAHSTEMNPDYSPGSLSQLDEDLPENLSEEIRLRGFNPAPDVLWAFHSGLGSYLGEVLIRNLGGEWRYPSRIVTFLAWLLNRPRLLYRFWYVIVRGKRVAVFEIARRREILGPKRASLARAYEDVARSCGRSGHGRYANE